MKRRLVLLTGTFAVLLLGYAGYYLASRERAPAPRQYDLPPVGEQEKGVPFPGSDTEVSPGIGLRIAEHHPKHHHLVALYTAEAWDKVGDRFLLKAPRMEWYLRGGEVITIQAEKGTVKARDIGGRWNIQEGELMGEVWILLDIATEPARPPLSERPGDAVRIHVDQMHFDRDALLIYSDSYVSVFARQADILGRGLRISWSMGPRELRELKILHGEYMCIRQGQERFVGEVSLPGPAEAGPPTSAPAPGAESSAAPLPAIRGGPALLAAELLPAALAATTATQAATGPATSTASAPAAAPVVKDTYCAVLTGDVVVTSGNRYLRNADEVKVVFEFQQPGQEGPAATMSASGPPETAGGRSSGGTRATGAATRPARAALPAAEPLEVTWSGPLVLKPLRGDEAYVPGRLDVEARGAALELADGRATARCKVFEFYSTDQRGRLVGTQAEPVQLRLAGGETSRAREIRFDRKRGVVNLDGEGEMQLPGGAGGVVAEGEAPAGLDKEGLAVRWGKDVEVLLGQRQVRKGEREQRQDFLLQATFNGQVRATQAPSQRLRSETLEVSFHRPAAEADPINHPAELHAVGGVHLLDEQTGDFIESERLDVKMSAPEEGRVYPKVAVARGKVSARQDQTEIATEELTATFAAEPDEKTGKLRVQATRLEARGGVKITDRREADAVTAEAQTLTTDLTERSAVLVGEPARVTQKDKEIEGERILFDQLKETATVVGAGRLRFDTRTDLSGNPTDKPRPVTIEWAKGLKYRGQERIAVLEGQVVLATAGDKVQCENMRVLFAPPEETAQPASSRAEEMVEFRPKSIAMVLAEKKVRLASVRLDAEGFLRRRLTLRSDEGQVVYESGLQKLTCLGPGSMMVEDYREPETQPDTPSQTLIPGGDVNRPSQSVFSWSKSMDMSQKDRLANLSGKVILSHRSGSELVLTEQLKLRPWGKLPAGRRLRMDCETMFAEFAAPDPDADEKGRDVLMGPRVGPLEQFQALAGKQDYVKLLNPPVEVVCRRILYQRAKDVAIIYGHLENEPPRNAMVYRKDVLRGRLEVMEENSKIIWRPSTNRVEGQGIKVIGSR